MPRKSSSPEIPVDDLRWQLDQSALSFKTTDDLEPLREIIGQKRGVEAFKFGMGIKKKGYNVFVTGVAGTGRMSTVKRLLEENCCESSVPDDLCYVNNFKNPEEPILFRFKSGQGLALRTILRFL